MQLTAGMRLVKRATGWGSSLHSVAALALLSGAGCNASEQQAAVELETQALQGENLAGANLAGTNLAGTNLAGTNLAGANLGGTNLAGNNLAGTNLAGTNLAGNNLAGNNLAGSNLAGANLAGANLAGANLAGSNLAGSNLAGSNLAGTNLAGNNLAGTNLAGSNLAGANSGANIHNLSGNITGMLYSREDTWGARTGQCVVMGIGSTAFAKLLGQQSANARINVALGKLPWGFSSSSGGSMALSAWEAIVWGDKTYCVFVMAAPTSVNWSGVAGFIKAVFRWQAPPAQSMDISGIEAARSAPVNDSSTSTTVTTYTGMMDAAARFRAGTVTESAFMAGELAFATATTNNQSVLVDFSAWVQDKNKNPLVLGNVTSSSPPTYAEALYVALDNGDGTISVIIDDAASRVSSMPAGMTNSVVDLDIAYLAYQSGIAPKPVPRRCGGALFLNAWFGEPVPAGKCDSGLAWSSSFCSTGTAPWSTLSGTTAPVNSYMQLTKSGGAYKRAQVVNGACSNWRPVISETYVHMWERNYDIPTNSCTPETDASFCSRRAKNCGNVSGSDNCGDNRTVASCGTCGSGNTCGGGGDANVCGNSNTKIYEAEGQGNTLAGAAVNNVCYQAFTKTLAGQNPDQIDGACWAGGRVRFIGGGAGNYVVVNNVNVATAGSYTLTVWAMAKDPRYFDVSVNGAASKRIDVVTPAWDTPLAFNMTVTLNAGNNTIKFHNASGAAAPDLDRIVVTPVGGSCTPESNSAFCVRLARNCGSVSGTDNCGTSRTVSSCGSCTSPQTCGGGGTANVCGSSSSGTCAAAYVQSSCLSLTTGSKVSKSGRNYTCANANCMNCASYATCAPGATGCPWGVVWTDNGACN
jgi:uncharacterized protein YjbI with pentapeptide repeats